MARLGDVCAKITDGSHNPPQGISCSEYLMLSSKNIYDDDISFDDPRYLSKENYETENKRTQISAGDILLTIVGTVGRAAVVSKTEKKICLQRSVAVIKPKQELIDSRFLMYQLQSMRTHLEQEARGVAQKGIYLRQVENLQIKVPSRGEQLQVVSNLDQISELISLRKQQLAKLDELVKARFVELFGDPASNSLGWKTDYLKNVTSKIGSGATPKGGKESYQADGITLIRSMNVHDGRFEYKDLAHITDEQAKQLDNVTIEENDVFINITGASVARSCIVPKHILPARVNQHVAIIRCITPVLNPVFANNMFLNQSFKGQLLDIGETGGATRQAITKQQLETLEVILPPIEMQNQFAAFVEQTDKSKLAIQESLAELETLKKALMQKYFG